jgi:hypothetical protein
VDTRYLLRPPETVVRVDSGGETILEPPAEIERWAGAQVWGYDGSGPNTTAATLLRDALPGRPLDLDLASICFTSDVLSELEQTEAHVITQAEIQAWADERMADCVEKMRAEVGRVVSEDEQREMLRELLEQGPRTPWLDEYRSTHGAPTNIE